MRAPKYICSVHTQVSTITFPKQPVAKIKHRYLLVLFSFKYFAFSPDKTLEIM